MKRRILTILWPLLVGGFPQLLPAQNTLYQATLTNAITTTTEEHVVLSNWAGLTPPGPNNTQLKSFLIDGELFQALAIDPPGTNYIRVVRAVRGTLRTPHAAGAFVWAGPDAAFVGFDPTGTCTRTAIPTVPIVSLQSRGTFDCMGGRYLRTDEPGASYSGTAIASGASATVTPPAQTFKISGTSAITTIATPAGWKAGMCLNIIPTGNFTTSTSGGNIAKASTAVTGRVLKMCFGGVLWYPSY